MPQKRNSATHTRSEQGLHIPIARMALIALFSVYQASADDFWQTNGPYGGTIRCVLVTRNGNIIAGADHDGIYRSSNGGAAWVRTHDQDIALSSIVEDPNDGTLFAASNSPGGVLRSTDEGGRWEYLSGVRIKANAIAVTSNGSLFAGEVGLYKSEDKGLSWTPCGLSSTPVYDVAASKDSLGESVTSALED
jgi:hypothetical protein